MCKRLVKASFLTIFAACAATPSIADDKIAVVATFSILGDIVSHVGGDRIAVRTLVGPEGDAHVYQPTPDDAASVSKAKALFENGLGFEGWIKRLKTSAEYKGSDVIASNGVKTIKGEDEEEEHGHEGEDHDAEFKGIDPHAFQSLANGLIYVANIKDGLCKIDANGCPDYTNNAEVYSAEIKALDGEIKKKIGALPEAKRKIITSHDAFGYFGKEYGVEFLAPVGMSTESEASAKDVAKLIDQIRNEKITALFVENITDTRLVEQIAKETGVKVGGTLYSDALSKADAPGATYLSLFRHNIELMVPAMAGS